MIKRYYHIRVEVRPLVKQEFIDKGLITVVTALVSHKSWFQDPDKARLHAFNLIVEQSKDMTKDNCMPFSFARC